MAILSTILGAAVAVVVLAIVLNAFFFWLGGKVANIKTATFGRSILIAIAVSAVTWMISYLLSVIPAIGGILGFILGAVLTIFIIKAGFEVKDYSKAFLAWILYLAAQAIAILIVTATFGGILLEALKSNT